MAPTIQIPPYPRNVPELPRLRLIHGKVYVSAKEESHKAHTAKDTPWDRMRFGNISEMSTHVTGASVSA